MPQQARPPPGSTNSCSLKGRYGHGVFPGRYKNTLLLIDYATDYAWMCGLKDTSGLSMSTALQQFFIDAGGVPRIIQCDFDKHFLGSAVAKLCCVQGIHLCSTPLVRQDKNGKVEARWHLLVSMCRAYLAQANLPKSFWFWGLREACICSNFLPFVSCTPAANQTAQVLAKPESGLTTPFKLIYLEPPDLCVLFWWGSVGYFWRPETGKRSDTSFASQTMPRVALGRSDNTSEMLFWDPLTHCFNVSQDFKLDESRSLGAVFPGLAYDGGFDICLKLDSGEAFEPFPPQASVFVRLGFDYIPGTVRLVPLPSDVTAALTDGSLPHYLVSWRPGMRSLSLHLT